MSDTNIRTQISESFRGLSDLIPDMRIGQLVATVGELCSDLHGRGLWDATDSEFLEAIGQFRRNYEAAAPGSTRKRA